MKRFSRFLFLTAIGLVAAGGTLAVVGIAYAVLVLGPQLPAAETLRDVRYQEPLRVLTAEGELIAEFGEKRRRPVRFDEVPAELVLAFIAAEDRRFYDHPGVDYQGIARAVSHLLREREFGPGGSTITMQVARNFFLSRDQTLLRKANEILLSLQIEQVLSKEAIIELYLNKIYLGNRAYGVAAAAQVYYGKRLDELDLAQSAMIAGLPKAPSAYNPLRNPQRALQRRGYVLGRMLEDGLISLERYQEAMGAPLTASLHVSESRVEAHYVAEMVRRTMVEWYGEQDAYTGGYTVYTTLEKARQHAANQALRQTLRDYDQRHGYRGPEGTVPQEQLDDAQSLDEALRAYPRFGGLDAAVVISVDDAAAQLRLRGGETVEVPFSSMRWARRYHTANRRGPDPEGATDVLSPGDIVRVERRGDGEAALAAVPEVEGALVALSPRDGRIRALSGGFDFRRSPFNRAVQAQRQIGSAIKPFVYSAALEHGYTAATQVNDAPVVFRDDALESYWRPANYSGRFYGPTRLREALVHSRNLVSIRVLRDIGLNAAIDHLEAFGFERATLPSDLSLALGSNSATPLQMATVIAVFANGGYRIEPNVVERVVDANGSDVFRMRFPEACERCSDDDPTGVGNLIDDFGLFALPPVADRVIPADNAWLISDMLRDVMTRGTGRGARHHVQRNDLAGKTGTTNDLRDAWFVGYNPDLAAAAWVGFDDERTLGAGETGAASALPLWSRFMAQALEGREERTLPRPSSLVTVRIDPESGEASGADNPNAIFETFREGSAPLRDGGGRENRGGNRLERELF